MTILGNFLLAISVFLLYGIMAAVYGRSTLRGGDAELSYTWGIVLLDLVFFACVSIVAIIIGWKGGFSMIPVSGYTIFIKVTGLLSISAVGTGISGILKNGSCSLPSIARIVIKITPVLLPVLILLLAGILLNGSLAQIVPLTYIRYLANASFSLGVLVIFIALSSFLNE